MHLYLYPIDETNKDTENTENRFPSTEYSNHMAVLALKDFICRAGLVLASAEREKITVLRDSRGKPYFEGRNDIFFSVSHSGNWWSCLMAEEEVGFDLEVIRHRKNFEGIAARFFTEEEYQYVLQNGLSGFYEIWVRKEAYVKYLGTGLSEGLRTFSVATKETLLQEVRHQQEDADRKCSYIIGFNEISSEIKAAYCCKSGNAISQTIILAPDQRP
ncbi:4'-phosphopantetheinyl transferase superfamily protein [Anoxybacterium hadale]|uniref:4'-phosphopantetheinyl transferase superfamily protein n=1 Tax=Anoxybacterium hadale TaxID=3408580 RepID=A0ACD1A9Y9_9FIRM|nr:4'-phosphopantetheinyl transferase superfamily protein [Clostridiales bacterium]